MGDNKCTLLVNDQCIKWRKNEKCTPSTLDWCDEPLDICELDRMCEEGSIFGNYHFYITEDQIEALRQGKVLFNRDEYGVFIALRKER